MPYPSHLPLIASILRVDCKFTLDWLVIQATFHQILVSARDSNPRIVIPVREHSASIVAW